jgi:hypothetical protein
VKAEPRKPSTAGETSTVEILANVLGRATGRPRVAGLRRRMGTAAEEDRSRNERLGKKSVSA